MSSANYRRILLKVSGEMLAGEQGYGIQPSILEGLASEIASVVALDIEVAVVIGGGNIFRGIAASASGMERASADYMGMLATVLNALALQNALERTGIMTRVQSAIEMRQLAEGYIRRRAIRHLEKKRVVIFAGGTGNPYFSTDTAAALRAMEIGAQVIMKGTKVDGIYDADPVKNPSAKKYQTISFLSILNQNLKVMDATAISLCMDNKLPLIVFNLKEQGNFKRVAMGEADRNDRHARSPLTLRESLMSNPAAIHQKVTEKMESALEHLKRDLAGLRTGRASVALLDGVRVDYYGTMTPLKQVANISTPEARLITIQPWEPNLIKEIEKALAGSGLGVTPSNDGKIIRVPLPPLTEERRKELSKICKKHGEDTKVVVRGFRRDANEELKKLQKDAKLTEDELRKSEADTQKLTDQYIQKIDDVVKKKEQEIMEV